tara:strand:+ start:152 stop:688 length:537 start_codon:yes stop_codon:yes gene_type:complete
MKRNILFGFLLIGLVVMEWGCCGGESHLEVRSIQNRLWNVANSGLKGFEKVKYDDVVISVAFNWSYVDVYGLGNTVYACGKHVMLFDTKITKALVMSDKNYLLDSKDVTSALSFRGTSDTLKQDPLNYNTSSNLNNSEIELLFNQPPYKTDTFQFTFQFFDTEGNMFETTTDPIIITP